MHVALDTTPLLGDRTGVGHAVAGMLDGFGALAEPDRPVLTRYVLSGRALLGGRPTPPIDRRLPLPAGLLHRVWAATGRPAVDGWLGRPAVVHGTNFVAPPLRHGTEVVTVHDLWDLPPRTLALVRATVRRGGWVHTPSAHVAGLVAERFATDRVRAVPWGVPPLPDGGAPPPGMPSGRYVLFLGRDLPRKHVGVLEEAAAAVPGVQLVLAGPGTERRRGGLGPVTEGQRAALLRRAAAVAVPSADEGFGFPVLEAVSVGVPVVAAAAGALPEVAGDAAVLVAPGDPAALAEGLRAALADAAPLVARGRVRAATFTWEATARGLAALYAEAAAERGSGPGRRHEAGRP
jgi:glycosyltransferase involved in cell wall biosynthesis